MNDKYNILVTSISKKVPLLKAVRKSMEKLDLGKVYGGDSNLSCIGRYFVDEFWHMPPQTALTVQDLISFCNTHAIKAIIPTRDDELPFFSEHQKLLSDNGIACMISNPQCIETCRNKLLFYQFLSPLEIPAIPTFTDLNLLMAKSFVVKECFGAGSKSIGLNLKKTQAKEWALNQRSPIYQPYIEGTEYSVDVYIDRQHSPHGAIARTRDLVVYGESQITCSVHHPEMEFLCLRAAVHLGIYGHAVFQLISDSLNNLHLIECNARFGGASSLSLAMGLHSFEWFLRESGAAATNQLSTFSRASIEMKQIRYPEDLVVPL
ncbi:MAG TPA: ATP-grasp domain-containing protein [Parachlamydiaceae bacterium]|nr:ATP-grasp domain-containing protein [Parachlamydiaceae bacterium]